MELSKAADVREFNRERLRLYDMLDMHKRMHNGSSTKCETELSNETVV